MARALSGGDRASDRLVILVELYLTDDVAAV
jgi:hypothetical protein